MTLQASYPITSGDINVELGRASNAAFSLQGTTERTLAGVASGTISMSDFLGKTYRNVTLVHTSTSASEVANYGRDFTGRWIVVLGVAGNSPSNYTLTATISGSAGTVIKSHSSGTGAGPAVSTGIITGQPTGTSGTVTVSSTAGTPPIRFYVLSVSGYNMGSALYASDSTGAGIPPWTSVVNIPTNGLLLGLITNTSGLGVISWTGVTEQIQDDSAILTGKIVSSAWDINRTANATATVNVTSDDTNSDTSAVIATFNAV